MPQIVKVNVRKPLLLDLVMFRPLFRGTTLSPDTTFAVLNVGSLFFSLVSSGGFRIDLKFR